MKEEAVKALPPPLQVHEFEETRHQHLPGSRASTVHARTWWSSSFRLLRLFGGRFAEFVRSFHRKPVTFHEGTTAVLWPMPVPYPSVLVGKTTSSSAHVAFQRAVNLLVVALNWLHLRRPRTCPGEVVLFQKLSKLQWKVVRYMEQAVTAWNLSEPISSSSMGRAASKVEDIELLLARLSNFESGVEGLFEELQPRNSDNLHAYGAFSSFAPGLQAETAGELIGQLPGSQLTVAKTIEADRIDFRGRPEFDAAPFLDPLGKSLYLDPVGYSMKPEESMEQPPPVKIFASESEKWKLLRKLDASGRLGAIREGEVYPGYQAGLFAIQKDGEKDRLIFDSRPWNTLEKVPNRWIRSMGSASALCELQVDSGEMVLTSGTDLREFYYSFRVTHSRLIRNSLLVTVWPWELRGFHCFDPSLEDEPGKLYLGLRTLAMGDASAVELAQTAHLGLLSQVGLLSFSNLISMHLPAPREISMVGVVIDDLVLFEKMAISAFENGGTTLTGPILQKALDRYTSLGLIPHPGKTFALKESEDFWGCLFEGRRGFVRASLKRVIPILFATLGVLKLGVTTLQLLEVLTGCWVSIFLFRRRMLSLLNTCYEALARGENRRSVLRISDSLRDELLLCCILAPLAATYLKAENSDYVFASDASDWGYAVVRAPLAGWMKREVHRHRLRKSTWVRLLSPVKARLRRKGELPAEEELPGGSQLATHPLWRQMAVSLPFEVVVKRQLRESLHINLGELQGMVAAEREAVRERFPVRSFDLADSQVALGVWIKGRSSSVALNQILQQSLAVHCGCGVTSNGGYVASADNPADDPTRHATLRGASEDLPRWWPSESGEKGEEDEVAMFDAWLRHHQADPLQLSGLPDLLELQPELEEDFQWTIQSKVLSLRAQRKSKRDRAQDRKDGAPSACSKADSPEALRLPTAESLGRRQLSLEAMEVLRRVPRSQFIFPAEWKIQDDNWRPDFPGYLDLYSGEKGVARQVSSLGKTWSITFEINDGNSQDVLLPENVRLIEDLLTLRCVDCMGAAIFCSSFSRAVRPPVRSRLHPDGLQDLSSAMQYKVELGNSHSICLSRFIALCSLYGVKFWVENPDGSFLWLQQHWRDLGANDYRNCLRLDYCACGTPWRKRTRVYTDLHLAGQSCFCDRRHVHRKLVGWSRLHGCSWTKLAQAYPRRLCRWLASAILIDIGLFPERRRIDVASLAKSTPGRIGEASNPGPRRPRQARTSGALQSTLLVEPSTELLGLKTWEAFRDWALRDLSAEGFDSLVQSDVLLGMLLEQFGFYLYESGQSLYLYRQILTFVQRRKPAVRLSLGRAWQVVSKWQSLEPTNHRTPLPLAIFRAMVALAVGLGWHRWAGILLLAFEGITRPGEALRAQRSDLLLPRDLIFESDDTVFLQIRSPKGRRRGIGAVQHTKIINRQVARFLDFVFGSLTKHESLYPAAPSTFRRRWDHILKMLHVPKSVDLTPAAVRAGGAVRAYRQNEDVVSLMWRMRLKQADTLQHYLQEVAAISLFGDLPEISQRKILAAGSLYSFLLDGK